MNDEEVLNFLKKVAKKYGGKMTLSELENKINNGILKIKVK